MLRTFRHHLTDLLTSPRHIGALTIAIIFGSSTYENTVYNFKISYPQDWQAEEADANNMGLVYGMLPPEEDADNPLNYVVVQVEALPAGATLAQYTRGLIQTMKQSHANLQILSTKTTHWGETLQESWSSLTGAEQPPQGPEGLYCKRRQSVHHNLQRSGENYDYYLETVREVILSFEFMGTENHTE